MSERKNWQEPSFIFIQEETEIWPHQQANSTVTHIPAFNAITFNSFYIEWEIKKEIHYVVYSLFFSLLLSSSCSANFSIFPNNKFSLCLFALLPRPVQMPFLQFLPCSCNPTHFLCVPIKTHTIVIIVVLWKWRTEKRLNSR